MKNERFAQVVRPKFFDKLWEFRQRMKVLYDEFVALRKSVNLGMHALKAALDRINWAYCL